jgi:hypothetical protein
MKTKPRKPKKPYWEMNLEELREATKEFDEPIPFSKMRPLRNEDVLGLSGGETVSQVSRSSCIETDVTSIHLDDELLKRAAEYVSKHKTSLPKMIDRGLRGLLAFRE